MISPILSQTEAGITNTNIDISLSSLIVCYFLAWWYTNHPPHTTPSPFDSTFGQDMNTYGL